jgi:hypothetical protein
MPWPSIAHWRTISPLLADSVPATFTVSTPVRAAQRPPAEILVALADDDAVVVVELYSSFVCSASSALTASAGK